MAVVVQSCDAETGALLCELSMSAFILNLISYTWIHTQLLHTY